MTTMVLLSKYLVLEFTDSTFRTSDDTLIIHKGSQVYAIFPKGAWLGVWDKAFAPTMAFSIQSALVVEE